MSNTQTILPGRTVTADMISRIERPSTLRMPSILSNEAALEVVKEMGEYDQMKLRAFQKKIAHTAPVKKGKK